MKKPTEYTFKLPDGSERHEIMDPDAGCSVMTQIGMFKQMHGAVSAMPTTAED